MLNYRFKISKKLDDALYFWLPFIIGSLGVAAAAFARSQGVI